MKILYVDLQYDYGDPKRGTNDIGLYGFKKSFETLGHDVETFYWDEYLKNPSTMQEPLKKRADLVKPDIIFFCLFRDQFEVETLNYLKSKYTTINWFGDDSWRFDTFTKYYANCFTYCVTTDKYSIPKYNAIGQKNVINGQWAALELSPPKSLDVEYKYDVSFVGGFNYFRKWFVNQLIKNGISVHTFGNGWPSGPIPLDQLRDTFLKSKINLNLSNSKSFDIRYVLSAPIHLAHTLKTKKNSSQMKARTFEIPYYGGFQLTDYAPALGDYFDIGRDLAAYRDIDEAILLIKYYLDDNDERERVKRSGYVKAMGKHSYLNRIKEILEFVGSSNSE